MVIWTIKIICISVLLIFFIHNICHFFANTLTKTDPNNKIEKYKILLEQLTTEIKLKNEKLEKLENKNEIVDEDMKNELKKYLKDQL